MYICICGCVPKARDYGIDDNLRSLVLSFDMWVLMERRSSAYGGKYLQQLSPLANPIRSEAFSVGKSGTTLAGQGRNGTHHFRKWLSAPHLDDGLSTTIKFTGSPAKG